MKRIKLQKKITKTVMNCRTKQKKNIRKSIDKQVSGETIVMENPNEIFA